eukprot:m.129801 g.129801  ORF g.129801 m.129801 type:complete len:543 (+) comp16419_c0_seq2:321-1949(+)
MLHAARLLLLRRASVATSLRAAVVGSQPQARRSLGTDTSLASQLSEERVFLRNADAFLEGQPVEMPPRVVHPKDRVFANSTTYLRHVDSYGFDYDFTLVSYTPALLNTIFNIARDYLVEQKDYPSAVKQLCFDRTFAIRGLYFDRVTGYLMKLDQFGCVQHGCVYHGHRSITNREFLEQYPGFRLSESYIAANMYMLEDLFSVPIGALLANITQLFEDHGIKRSPVYLFSDMQDAVRYVHTSGILHTQIIESPHTYINTNSVVSFKLLDRLRTAGKHVFLLTNSEFDFVNAGMTHIFNLYQAMHGHEATSSVSNWVDYFDAVITNAKKPLWFDQGRSFRRLDPETGRMTFHAVSNFEKGGIYTEGGLLEFQRLTGLSGQRVVYMGDHIFSDLLAPSRAAQWKTVAIIKELEAELEHLTNPDFAVNVRKLQTLEQLIAVGTTYSRDILVSSKIRALKDERTRLRGTVKTLFNVRFGSIFRTFSHRSAFFFALGRYCDLYTGSVTNFLHYPLDDVFYASRSFFVHEIAAMQHHDAVRSHLVRRE